MAAISRLVNTSVQLFKNGYKGQPVKYLTKNLPSGTNIKILNKGNYLEKTVTKTNGNKIISKLTPDGKDVLCIREVSKRGTIEHLFGAQNFDKTVQVTTKDGGIFNFLGHKNRQNGLLYSNAGGKYQANNDYMPQYKNAMNYIRGKISDLEYILGKIGKNKKTTV